MLGHHLLPLLVSSNGQVSPIPNWTLVPESLVSDNAANLSRPGEVLSPHWHHIPVSKCNLIGCLHAAGVSPWNDLAQVFTGDNMESHRSNKTWKEPWFYRQEFLLNPGHDKHFLLETNGITSKADLYLNGGQIASKYFQSGTYSGHTYDITPMASEANALLIRVHPTNYNHDLAQGFNDWNHAPPDNGSGVWRDVNIKQTGPVALGPLSVTTEFEKNSTSARVTLRTISQNLENRTVEVFPLAVIIKSGSTAAEDNLRTGRSSVHLNQVSYTRDVVAEQASRGKTGTSHSPNVVLAPFASKEIHIQMDIPFSISDIWWPKQWGSQPLFEARLSVSVDEAISDTRRSAFGFRKVTSRLNDHDDREFELNRVPFQVLGAGYTPDIFLRWDPSRFTSVVEYVLDLGLNTIRLEGKMEQPEFYEICDQLGIMVLPGWECCDKWEAWSYSEEEGLEDSRWGSRDYTIANASMRHEAAMLQTHPSVLGFLIGSDLWPDARATSIYLDALRASHWETPVIASASGRGHPKNLSASGLKMDGPYSWVPPNYWYDDRLGAAFGFGSELGAGVGTPELPSLSNFLNLSEIDDLWQRPDKALYHMSPGKTFSSRKIYNKALRKRYGNPKGLSEYLLSAQMMDYEATRAQFEAYASKWSAKRPATGVIYWLLNSAWPNLHWNLFDYYLHPAGSYFGTKTGSRIEHAAYDYKHRTVSIINRSIDRQGYRTLDLDIIDLKGGNVLNKTVSLVTKPNSSSTLLEIKELRKIKGTVLLRLVLKDSGQEKILSRNVYWLSKKSDKLKWRKSDWYYTPVKKYANYKSLNRIQTANISVSATMDRGNRKIITITLENRSPFPAVFIRLNVVHQNTNATPGNSKWANVAPVKWSDNYVTLFPHEKMVLHVEVAESADDPDMLLVNGKNIRETEIPVR